MLPLAEAYRRITDAERERSFVITDPRLEDNPIVFVNQAFCRLTGYSFAEVGGRNCRFLQGKDTNPDTIRAIHEAIEGREALTADILNYRKDGTPFWNRLRIRPTFSEAGKIDGFLGLQNLINLSEVHHPPRPGIYDV